MGEEDRQRDVLREVMKHKVDGKYTALQAAQLLEAEGIKVPETLLMELGAPKIFESFTNMDEAAKADAANLSPHEVADIYKKFMG
ncbi:hypothetical protein [Escherichia sp. E1130]|uniref:hypothetical protein n=1 Tax=Escherichia sp. E1130 TaxID=2041645 RepID=UPI001080AFFB|nr:hypothetical protein [Escherichia sp. E1130]TGC25294.1 hypothetical protein CQJ27_12530 [Escherichia sp. E1130]